MIRLGANTVLFGTHDLRTAMECIKRSGYDAAEISALPGMADHLPLDNWRSVATEIRALVEELELPLTAMEVGTNAEDRLMLAYEAGAELGIPVINVGPGRKPDDPGGLQGLIDHLNAMAAKAEEFGVILCMKAHVNTIVDSTPTTLAVMGGVTSPEPHPPRRRGAEGGARAGCLAGEACAHPRLRRPRPQPRQPGAAGLRAR